ncbi:hypothetical protein ACHQM5_027588 [Ranunculus cassubicifolius]
MAQNRSSPIDFLSRSFPFTSTMRASRTLSADRPYFLHKNPSPPPLTSPPIPTVVQIDGGNASVLLCSAIL